MPRSANQPLVVDAKTSARLGQVRQRDTKPELARRRVLHRLGVRYRLSNRDLPGSPDGANRKKKWVVFAHGRFWHRHTGCHRATTPKQNRKFWLKKFDDNPARDGRVIRSLRRLGYRTIVIVIWACETMQADRLARRLGRLLTSSGSFPSHLHLVGAIK